MKEDARLTNDREVLLKRIADMQEQAAAMARDLDRANRLATLGVLAGMIAHEFNNLLTPVMSYSQLALASPDDRDLVHKALVRTVDGAEHLAKVAAAILGFLNDDVQYADADIDAVINEALACMARDPGKLGIVFIRDIPAGLRVAIRPICLQQVLLNLFLNAIGAMRGQPGQLLVRAKVSSRLPSSDEAESADAVVIDISDTGRGIPLNLLDRIFEPFIFHRLESGQPQHASADSRSTKAGGHGLGLAICKRLIEEAGGSIAVASNPGEGTCFTITLNRGRIIATGPSGRGASEKHLSPSTETSNADDAPSQDHRRRSA